MHLSDWNSAFKLKTAVTAITIAVADTEQKTNKETDEEADDIRNTGAPTTNYAVMPWENVERESVLRAETATLGVQTTNPERKEMMNEYVINTDCLVTSKLIAFTTNEFKTSVLKLRKPASDRNL
ncbi:hypothetical protein BDD12DRAFT_805949 [Trichophaea hybrida]|nr:hypothetical protein BDD12DRAFT_805949 [Trichophaea hybrida]